MVGQDKLSKRAELSLYSWIAMLVVLQSSALSAAQTVHRPVEMFDTKSLSVTIDPQLAMVGSGYRFSSYLDFAAAKQTCRRDSTRGQNEAINSYLRSVVDIKYEFYWKCVKRFIKPTEIDYQIKLGNADAVYVSLLSQKFHNLCSSSLRQQFKTLSSNGHDRSKLSSALVEATCGNISEARVKITDLMNLGSRDAEIVFDSILGGPWAGPKIGD
jgi:hypothetical protein